VISVKFLGDNNVIEFWVAQFLTAIDRWLSKNPSPKLQGVLFLDEADMYLPAKKEPATKWPMENLLKRARSGGLGLMLATQSPGDLDYKCRENVRNWFLGRIQQDTALRKLKTVFDTRNDLVSKLPGQATGTFMLVRDGQPIQLTCGRSTLRTEQLPQDEILSAARQSKK
jgi:DNA helicase HerA-like ATPase